MKTLLVAVNAKYIHSNLAIHCIEKYCKGADIETLELSINIDDNQVIKQIYKRQPDIIGFSCYIWNIEYIKTIIPTLKKILPHVKIVLGGPEVSFNCEELLNELPVDLIMEGEGEITWKLYLAGTPLCDIPAIVYKNANKIVKNPRTKAMNLAELPFVYQDLDPFVNKIIYYESSRGCPFNCSYCISGIDKGVRYLPLERVLQNLEYFLTKKIKQVKFVDRTFNANFKFALEVWKYIIKYDNGITNFHFELAAELITKEMLYVLQSARAGLIQFEIGVQTTNADALVAINRPMPFAKLGKIVQNLKQLENIHLHLDLIVGLPHEDYHSFRKSFNDVISLRPEQLQLGFLKVLKGSQMEQDADKYGIVYKDYPPYEVLSTKYISYDEVLKLHTICEMVERFYNSNRFERTLSYMFELYPTPFIFFEQLAEFWERQGYEHLSHKKESYYLLLLEFMQQTERINVELIKELIRFDWLLHENIKDHMPMLATIDQSKFKETALEHLKDPAVIIKMAAGHLNMKQRQRMMHVEYFQYDLTQDLALRGEPMPIIFLYEYGQSKARWLQI